MVLIKAIQNPKLSAPLLVVSGSAAGSFLVAKAVSSLSLLAIPLGYAFALSAVAYVLWAYSAVVYRMPKVQRLAVTAGVATFSIAIFGIHALPAHAQFLNGAEDLFTSLDVDEDLVEVVFNLLRFAFVIAFAVSLLPAFNAARDGDDWKALAKPPVLAAVLIAVSDAVVELITG
ncbi:MAG: hypothetical protein ABG776_05090 [Cyanobacteria bacterium J06555_13]